MSDDVKHSMIWGTVTIVVATSLFWSITTYNMALRQHEADTVKHAMESGYSQNFDYRGVAVWTKD